MKDIVALITFLALMIIAGCSPAPGEHVDKGTGILLKEGEKVDPETGNVYSEELMLVLPTGCRVNRLAIKQNNYLYYVYMTTCPGTVNWSCSKNTECKNSTVIEPTTGVAK